MVNVKHGKIVYHKLTGTAMMVVSEDYEDYTKADCYPTDRILCRYMDYVGRFYQYEFDRMELTDKNPNESDKPAKEVKSERKG